MHLQIFSDGNYGFIESRYSLWTDDQLTKINKILIEICAICAKNKITSDGTSENREFNSAKTVSSHLCGLKRGFKNFHRFENLGLFKSKVFNHPERGMFHVIDNICKTFQAEGNSYESQNVLTTENLR